MAQRKVLTAIQRAIADEKATAREALALKEAGIVESHLTHLRGGDRDATGFLQQRPSQGWGDVGESAYKDAVQFLRAAKRVNRAGFHGSAGQLAQAVQRSAFPGRYDAVRGQAVNLAGARPGKGGGSHSGGAATVTPARFDAAGFSAAERKAAILSQLLSHGNPNTTNPLVKFGLLSPDRAAFTTPGRAAGKSAAVLQPSTRQGKFRISGPQPGRLKPELVSFAKRVAAVYGQPLTGLDGSTHSKYTVNGNVSEHYSGNATDIPLRGKALLKAGRAALIAAGMPRKQAMRQTGGLFNVGRHQIIFLTNEGGNHYDHLHISTHAR